MPTKPGQHAEPLPGYILRERLGQGGFGEVWSAMAPGGIPKAIKFVHGSIDDDENKTAAQELKSLNRMKSVHHPFILGVERVDVIDGQVVIVMELADRDLQHRHQECQRQGLPGIPREELLRYLEEAAEALDLMNNEYQLQHLDIKPQNLFLVRNHIKVADFGLAKDLEGLTATLSAGITPVYASPETFDGRVSRYSDQYSLAIVYQEMLTGKRPFNGTNARMLLMQHVKLPPDLTALAEADRPIVDRALAKDPNQRWPSCTDFVQALRAVPAASTTLPQLPPTPGAKPPAANWASDAPTIPLVRQDDEPAEQPSLETAAPDDLPPWPTAHNVAADRGAPDQEERHTLPDRAASEGSDYPSETRTPASRTEEPARRTVIRPPAPAAPEKKRRPWRQEDEPRPKPASLTVQLPRLPVTARSSLCPRCQGPLSDLDTLPWCPKCGYFSARAEENNQAARAKGAAAILRLVERWQWILLGGMTLICLTTFVAGQFFPERSHARAVLSLVELGLALLGLGAAHLWAMRLACFFADGKLGLGEVARWPVLVWKAMFYHLPDSSGPINLSSWSGALVFSALFLGGLGYWLKSPAPPPPHEHPDPVVELQRQQAAALEAKLAERKRKWASEPTIPAKPVNLDRDLDEVYLAGYILAPKDKGTISAVVLASNRGGKLIHVGTTSQGFSLADNQELSRKIALLPGGERPETWDRNTFSQVVWLPADSRLRLVVDHAGQNPDGTLNDPGYRRLKD